MLISGFSLKSKIKSLLFSFLKIIEKHSRKVTGDGEETNEDAERLFESLREATQQQQRGHIDKRSHFDGGKSELIIFIYLKKKEI